jgi:putative oxidoreductase
VIERDRLEAGAFAALRIVCGVLMACHGFQKLFGVYGPTADVGSQIWIGGIIELAGGLLVAVGWHARLAAFVLSGQMAVAYFQFHWKLQFAGYKFLPIVNHGEDAVVYCFVFLFIWAHGAGRYSLDRRLSRSARVSRARPAVPGSPATR